MEARKRTQQEQARKSNKNRFMVTKSIPRPERDVVRALALWCRSHYALLRHGRAVEPFLRRTDWCGFADCDAGGCFAFDDEAGVAPGACVESGT